MRDDATQAIKYRELAAQLRLIANDTRGDDSRRLLLKVANDYDGRALDLEAIDQPLDSN